YFFEFRIKALVNRDGFGADIGIVVVVA
ncbi:MAG: hypothetical protein RL427_848, partial [Bacteroidota bacterium]